MFLWLSTYRRQVVGHKKRADQRPALFLMLRGMECPHKSFSSTFKGVLEEFIFSY